MKLHPRFYIIDYVFISSFVYKKGVDIVKKLWFHIKNVKGQGLVEYALIIAVIAIAMVIVLQLLSGEVQDLYNSIVDEWPAP